MGYRPNRLAQGLGRRRSNVIGLMIPGLRNPFFLNLLEIAEEAAFEAGYDVFPDIAFQMRESYNRQSKLSGWPMDGILIWITPDKKLSDYLGTWSELEPVVYLGYERDDGADFVAIDREGGVRQAMNHLWSRGYERIGYLYPWAELQPSDSRYAVYERICAEAGRTPQKIRLEPNSPPELRSLITQAGLIEAGFATGLTLAARPASERLDAMLCHNDLVAIGFLNGIRRAGLRVPEDLAIVGFDGIDEGLLMEKPLTTVITPTADLVRTGFKILSRRLDTPVTGPLNQERHLLPCTLRVGGTT
jgi:LacI family transcriptional regulator